MGTCALCGRLCALSLQPVKSNLAETTDQTTGKGVLTKAALAASTLVVWSLQGAVSSPWEGYSSQPRLCFTFGFLSCPPHAPTSCVKPLPVVPAHSPRPPLFFGLLRPRSGNCAGNICSSLQFLTPSYPAVCTVFSLCGVCPQ